MKNNLDEFQLHKLIQAHFQAGEYGLAKEAGRRLLKARPSSIPAHQELGNIYLEEGDLSRSIKYFRRVLELCARQGGRDNDSLRVYLRESHINMGRAYLLMKRYSRAIEALKEALELAPQEERIYRFLALAYLESKDYDSAVDIAAGRFKSAGKNENSQAQAGIKMLRIPNFYGPDIFSTEMNSIMLPPLALGSIVSYVRSRGISIDQDDLHIKIHHDNYFGDEQAKIEDTVFFDAARVAGYAQGNDDQQIEKIMERASRKTGFAGYKIILFSLDSCSMNDSHALFAVCLARYLKKRHNPIIILGGLNYFADLMRKIGCPRSDIDHIIGNEGEEVVTELLASLLDNKAYSGTGRQEGEGVISSVKVPAPAMPDFDGLPLDKYCYRGLRAEYCADEALSREIKEFNDSRVSLLPFRFIKGCTNKCIFCASSSGGLIHAAPPAVAAGWLRQLQERYEPTGYLFLNDTLNISKKYVDQFCDEIMKSRTKARWSDCARVDRLDQESIYKMAEAGCVRLVFGMETASRRLLKYINKEIDLAQLEKALYWADKAGIWTGVEIISGLPYEREKDVAETIDFLRRNREHIDAFYYNAFNIKDTSAIRSYPERYGIGNIFELSSYEEGFSTFVKYGFDEIGGLKWPEKRKQVVSSFNKVIGALGEPPFPEHEYESFLFFLYSKYTDKRTIRNIFYSVGRQKNSYLESLRKAKRNSWRPERAAEKTLVYG